MSTRTPAAGSTGDQVWTTTPGVQGYVWRAPSPRAVLLLQHGYREYATRYVGQYNALIPHLLETGLDVYALDLRGHGRSSGRRGMTDIHQAVRDHLTARKMLRGQPLPVFLLGHSLGGLVTASSVALEPSGLRGVILTSAAVNLTGRLVTRLAARVLARVAPNTGVPHPSGEPTALSRIPETVEAVKQDPLMFHGKMPARLAATAMAQDRANWRLFERWTVPTLVLHGTADRATDPQGSQRLFETILSQDKTLQLIDGGYHELLNDIDAEKTLEVILHWLRDRMPPG